jgi:hypothetical protein
MIDIATNGNFQPAKEMTAGDVLGSVVLIRPNKAEKMWVLKRKSVRYVQRTVVEEERVRHQRSRLRIAIENEMS